MPWIYFPESAVYPSHLARGLEPSPTVKMTPTLKRYYCPECGAGNWIIPQSRRMCANCREQICSDRWMLFPLDFPAKTSVLLELERVWMEVDRGLCLKSLGSFASVDLISFSWKTSQLSLFEDLTEFSWSSLLYGLMFDGQLFQPQRWEPHTYDAEFSFLPTPTANSAGTNGKVWNEESQTWESGRPSLETMASQNLWPDHDAIPGPLNPEFSEWLMGYPIGWTALDAVGIQWFQTQLGKHSKDY